MLYQIKLPNIIEVTDYHELDWHANTLNRVLLGDIMVSCQEIFFNNGMYYGVVYDVGRELTFLELVGTLLENGYDIDKLITLEITLNDKTYTESEIVACYEKLILNKTTTPSILKKQKI